MKLFCTILLLPVLAHGQSSLTADVYLGMTTNPANTTVTAELLTSGTSGTIGSWTLSTTPIHMSFEVHRMNLRVPVIVGATTFPVDFANTCIAMDLAFNFRNIYFSIPAGHRSVTVSGFITPGADDTGGSNGYYDCVNIAGVATGRGCVLQLDSGGTTGGGSGYRFRIETNPGGVTAHSVVQINITPRVTYWFSLNGNFTTGSASLALYETTGWTQVGSTATATQETGEDVSLIELGNPESGTTSGQSNYWEHVIVDYSNGLFPLGPGLPAIASRNGAGRPLGRRVR